MGNRENTKEFSPDRFIGSLIDYKGHRFDSFILVQDERLVLGYSLPRHVELVHASFLYSFNWELPLGKKKEDADMRKAPRLATHKKTVLSRLASLMFMLQNATQDLLKNNCNIEKVYHFIKCSAS